MSEKDCMDNIIAWLEERHKAIMDCEAQALACLERNDSDSYKQKMREKAEMLLNLDKDSRSVTACAPDEVRWEIQDQIGRFSAGAAMAIKLNSPFYMSALLYPDDHKKGEPDNMAVFIARLKSGSAI